MPLLYGNARGSDCRVYGQTVYKGVEFETDTIRVMLEGILRLYSPVVLSFSSPVIIIPKSQKSIFDIEGKTIIK